MAPLPEQATAEDDEYMQLPEVIRFIYTRSEWLWLTDEQKARLIDRECEPEF